MVKFRNILVVIDPTKEEQAALSRAAYICQKEENAKLKLFLSVYDFSFEMTTMLSLEEREAMRSSVIAQQMDWLEELAAPYRNQGLLIDTKVIWHNRPFESIIQETLDFGHDLVVKATHHHPKLQSVIFTPTDWHLLRKCPEPLLLVKKHDWPENGTILAAINATAEDDEHLALNDKITNEALDVAKMINAHVSVVNAYPSTPMNIALELPDFNPVEYRDAIKERHQQMLQKHGEKHSIPLDRQHVIEGLAEDVIPLIAEELDAELVVLGTVGRTGLSAALIGNTAEHLIDSLNCDLLALKPHDYVSPLSQ
ncbi:universal stress protein UspE [Motilimonas sp. 1_MG-2023]|uniref:universal stress protein UspE n=1 Tax=Motilimonas sp. 1_MG-2023 TaxID=3062672 RepID=UPI0026E43AA4|nr:universal stress protein UspE [Motilimonas sp. 1_MG-2023]MDO6527238.1 universal stress protein UspE [Motilimonas sp. 1_MG-2023]